MGCKLKRSGGDNLGLCLEIWEGNVGQTLWRSSTCLEVSQEYSFTERATRSYVDSGDVSI